MKILCFSDVHSNPQVMAGLAKAAKTVDALCCGGDILDASQNIPSQLQVWHEWVKETGKPVALCDGNHDFLTAELSVPPGMLEETPANRIDCLTPYFLAKRWVDALPLPDGSTGFPGSSVLQAAGEKIWITSIPYEAANEDQFWKEGAEKRKRGVPWMVLRHEPPATCALSEPTTGSPQARRFLQKYQPDFFLCGHIHSAPFSSKTCWCIIGKTLGINPGHKAGMLSYALLDTAAREVKWVVERLAL